MIGLLARVLIGVAIGAAAVGTTYAVYKILTKDKIKEDVQSQLSEKEQHIVDEAFDIKVKEKVKKGEVIHNLDDMDSWATEDTVIVDVRDKNKNTIISNIQITGDEFGDDIRKGSVITLKD